METSISTISPSISTIFLNPNNLYMVLVFKCSISKFWTSIYSEFMQSFLQQAQAEGFVEHICLIYVFIGFFCYIGIPAVSIYYFVLLSLGFVGKNAPNASQEPNEDT